MENLEGLGWDEGWAMALAPHLDDARRPARVAAEHRGLYELLDPPRVLRGRAARRMEREGGGGARPVVGDWIAYRPAQNDGGVLIEAVLPRRTTLSRREPGAQEVEQVLAANVDLVFLIAGLDHDFNLRRMERALVLVWESGARPVVLLNKADACGEVAQRCHEMESVCPGVPVHPISALHGSGLDGLRARLGHGRTAVLIGSSGAGKSTLANRLLGDERLATQPVRPDDSRGRHTTTHRSLLALPGGGVLIDTPGLRELQLWAPETALDAAFSDIEALACGCRFRDCRHEGEPGCAVTEAAAAGTLDAARLASYRKLQRELEHHTRRVDAQARLEQRRKWKAIHKQARHHRPRE
jgi:ribosome biogenesis GTPase